MKSFPYSEDSILEDLSPSLRREVVLYLNKEMVENVPLFKNQPKGFICRLILAMNQEISAPLDWIIQEGEVGRCMYFLRRGLVEVCSIKTNEVFARLSDGAFFGEIALISSGIRTASIRAIYHCDMLTLDKSDLDNALKDYPGALRKLLHFTVHGKYKLSEFDKQQLKRRFSDFKTYLGAGIGEDLDFDKLLPEDEDSELPEIHDDSLESSPKNESEHRIKSANTLKKVFSALGAVRGFHTSSELGPNHKKTIQKLT
eukprot:CAMPEP_0204884330 /NCGR_PEP_ID=MMETSP1349-20130617/9454_1 /ASSEMBLY_ACC=CAM_ASM_000710 /TAXON_ID=215587 /ORGANISM="Aplanochytrium stocchinoi, Strain GSBS06" /LENGTH=256 /DNA_ID=CAMNT_0052045075 /DNA_START=37 /DNA_END=807 /DNA_ORIENTATION=-